MRAVSHLRLRRAIGRYADGELDATCREALVAHLLGCDGCRRELAIVRAIKGSLRRLADAEPADLAATRLRRWTASLPAIGGQPSSQRRDRGPITTGSGRAGPGSAGSFVEWTRHRRVPRLVGAVTMVVVAAGVLLQRADPTSDPGTMAALVELARVDPQPGDPEPRDGHTLELADQRVSLLRRIVHGREVLIAISDRAFAMPADARPVSKERDAPLLAKRGDMSIACFSRPTHMLVVGPLPAERLIDIGGRVG